MKCLPLLWETRQWTIWKKVIAEIDNDEAPDDVTQEWIDNHQDEIELMKEE